MKLVNTCNSEPSLYSASMQADESETQFSPPSPLKISEIAKPGRSVEAFKCRHRCWPEQDATRRTTNCFLPFRAAAYNDHFTCPIFLRLKCSRLHPPESLGPSPAAADAENDPTYDPTYGGEEEVGPRRCRSRGAAAG